MSLLTRQRFDPDAEPSDGLRSCWGVPVATPSQPEWALLAISLGEFVSFMGLSAYILSDYLSARDNDDAWREHVTCSVLVIIQASFAIFFALHGIFRLRREDLYCLVFTSFTICFIVLYDFFIYGDQSGSDHLTRLALVAVFLPFNFASVVYILRLESWQDALQFTAAEKANRSRFFALQKILIQYILTLNIIFNIERMIHSVDKFVLLSLSIWCLVAVFLGWKSVSKKSRIRLAIAISSSIALVLFSLALLVARWSQWRSSNIHAFFFGVGNILMLVVAELGVLYTSRFWWRSFDGSLPSTESTLPTESSRLILTMDEDPSHDVYHVPLQRAQSIHQQISPVSTPTRNTPVKNKRENGAHMYTAQPQTPRRGSIAAPAPFWDGDDE